MALLGRETVQDQQRAEAWRLWYVRQHPLALASAVLSLFSLTHLGTLWVDEIAGIVLGAIAIRAVKKERSSRSVRLAYVGIAAGILSLLCAIVVYSWPAAA